MKKANSFWDFSLRIYSQKGVEPSCLELQNNYGCDVNLLLFCCWGGLTYEVIPEDIVGRAVDYSKVWQSDVVQPLRDVRSRMKGRQWITAANKHENLRDRVKSAELEAERLQQAVLEQLVCNLPVIQADPITTLDAIVENLNRYFKKAGIKLDRAACLNLDQILSYINSDHPPLKLDSLMIKN